MLKHAPSGLLAVAALLFIAAGVGAEEEQADPAPEAPPTVEIGQKVPDFTIADVAGQPFQLAKSAITRADAEAAVRKAAAGFGAAEDAGLDTKIEDLAGVQDEDGDADAGLVRDLACAAGAQFGLIATEDSAEAFETLGDLVTWIEGAKDAPMLFIAWSPNCPSVKRQNERLVEVLAASGVRAFALASNYRDTDEHYAKFREAFEFNLRIFPDRDQRVTDLFGGKVTPHYMLVDKTGVLRYRGALDNDAMGYMDEDEREDWVLDAVAALKAGKELAQTETEPSG